MMQKHSDEQALLQGSNTVSLTHFYSVSCLLNKQDVIDGEYRTDECLYALLEEKLRDWTGTKHVKLHHMGRSHGPTIREEVLNSLSSSGFLKFEFMFTFSNINDVRKYKLRHPDAMKDFANRVRKWASLTEFLESRS